MCAPPDPLPVGVPCLDGVPCLGGVPCAGRGGLLPVGVAVRVGVVVPLGVVWGGGRCGVVGVAERGGGVLAMALGGRCAGVGVPSEEECWWWRRAVAVLAWVSLNEVGSCCSRRRCPVRCAFSPGSVCLVSPG